MTSSRTDWVAVGRVARPHGLGGEVVVDPWTDFPERLAAGAELHLRSGGAEPRPARIASARPHAGRVLVRFEGVTTVDGAEALRDAELCVPESEVAPRPEGFYYHFDLEGAEAVDVRGAVLGRVASLDEVGGRSLLVLDTPRGPRPVPFVAPIVVSVDAAARRIVLDPPKGLLDDDAV